MSNKLKGWNLASKILFHTFFVLNGLALVGGPIVLGNASIINSYFHIQTQSGSSSGSTYFNTDFKNLAEVKEASLSIIEESEAEGAVLLKNENSALPLTKGDGVSMYGFASYYTVYTGQGSSGNTVPDDAVCLYDGLKNAGFEMNEDLFNWYKGNSESTYVSGSSGFRAATGQETQFVVSDAAWSSLPSAKDNAARAAVMVLARTSGEAEDLYMDTTMDGGDQTRVIVSKKNHNNPSGSVGDSLALSDNEKSVLSGLKAAKDAGTIDKIVVLVNSSSPLQGAFINDASYGIDAALWVGDVGTNGANAVGKILTGEINPSGKTSDTFFADSKYNPVYFNFGSQEYVDADSQLVNGYFSTMGYQNHKYYSVYQEGIYNGYKYTETRYEDTVTSRDNVGSFNYSDVVSYPFGYGLSYSKFTYGDMTVKKTSESNIYTVSVKVTNDSDVKGKEAVEVYLQKPYTAKDIANGIETASVELVGFDKVEVEPHQSVTATIDVDEKYFAAYDANVEKTYVIGSDDANDKYLLTAAKDSHDAINNILQYKKDNGTTIDNDKLYHSSERDNGSSSLVYGVHLPYDATKYSTNEFIKSENENFVADYDGEVANYGVDMITNQFDDVDFKKAGIFSSTDTSQSYMTRSNWDGTYGKQISLTANAGLKLAQASVGSETDKIEYPKYDEVSFIENGDSLEEIKLINLRDKDYNDPMWDELLNRMSYSETCSLLQDGLRYTNGVESIAAPSSAEQNGALAPNHPRTYSELPSQSGFRGFSETLDPSNKSQTPRIFCCNGIVASTYNLDLIERLGVQTGEEAIWAGYNGIYGLGVNIHRGAYCGRSFEYYSEDGFLTGTAAGYEAVGLHKKGVFVLMKHAVLNDQETHRAGLNVWANEQSIREVYCRAIEVAVSTDRANTKRPILGVMTGMNRLGAKWTGSQGFCNTVLKAEFGMRGYVVSDYNSSRLYMGTIDGVLNGNDLPDGNPAGAKSGMDYDGKDLRFASYSTGHGKLAWAMRKSAKNILYTIANSNTMNGIDSGSTFKVITPTWQKMVPVVERVTTTIFVWTAVLYGSIVTIGIVKGVLDKKKNKSDSENK